MDDLVHELARRMGEKTRVEGAALRAIVQHGDAFLATRVRTKPTAEVFVATRPLDGFTLSIKWGDRWNDPDVGDLIFDNAFSLVANDSALMRSWLDDESRRALLASAYSYEIPDALGALGPTIGTRTWSYELANDELIVSKGAVEHSADRFMVAIDTACTIAARSQRWAAAYGEIARRLGGHAVSEVELGGAPVITATRSAIEVGMRLLRLAHGGNRLRTVISAPRIGDGRLALAHAYEPKLPDSKRFPVALDDYKLRASDERAAAKIDDVVKKLVLATKPEIVIVDADSVDVWFDGALAEHARIEPAFALAAHLAVDAIAAQGPYR